MVMTQRTPGWMGRLVVYLSRVHSMPFRPGRMDCALFVAGAVEAMTGEDHARGWRGYRSLAEGRKRIAERGHEDHVALAASLLPEVPVLMAQRGDVAVVPESDGFALGIVQGESVYVMTPRGLGLVPLTRAVRAFRV